MTARTLAALVTALPLLVACAQPGASTTAAASAGVAVGADAFAGARLLQPVAAAATGDPDKRPAGLPAGEASGALKVLLVGGEEPDEALELPLTHTDVKVRVSGFVARAEVTQAYANPYNEPIEAVYTFPLPHQAAVDDMVMTIGERVIRGRIERRNEARRLYQEARDRGQRASLLEQERPNVFTQSVANIMPGDQITVTIGYVDVLDYSDGAYELVFPTVVGPRYIPGGQVTGHEGTGWAPDTDVVPDASRITPPVLEPGERSGHDIALTVDVDAGVPIRGIHSTSHVIDVSDDAPTRARVRIHPSDTIPNKDFVLRYEVAGEAPQVALIPHHDERGGFFTLIVQPQREVSDDQVVPRELIFILDTSGSMSGFPMDRSKEAMRRLLAGMRPGDTFNVVRFAGGTGTLWPRPIPYTDDNARAAMDFVNRMRGSGGTEMRRGIIEALSQPAADGMLRIAFLLTDGYVGDDERILRTIEETRRGARVFTLGVGSSVNRYLLDRAATVGLGEAFYVLHDEDSEGVIDSFFSRVDRPALAHVEIDWGGLDVTSLYPRRVPDLWAGQPIRLHGRYTEGGTATVTISGRLGSRAYSQQVEVTLPQVRGENEAIASVWARHKIKHLMLEQAKHPSDELVEEITVIGLEFRLMTRWTSFVAVEELVVNVDGRPRTVVQPVEIPDGVSYEGVFGVAAQVAPGKAALAMNQSMRMLAASPQVARRVRPQTGRVPIPDPTPGEPEPLPRSTSEEVELELDVSADLPIPGPEDDETAQQVRLGTVAVHGGLQHPDVVRVLKGALPDLRSAYGARLTAERGLSGQLRVTLTIAGDGTVSAVAFDDGSLVDEPLRQRVREILVRLVFGAVAGGDEARVTLDLELMP